jgi:fatty-acyl-CoA synthase
MGQYWRDEAATRAAFREGWLLTGDLGYQDQDGRLHIVGRKKRLIISGGENIHPAEIEQVLERHPGIQEAAVIGFPDPEWGEVPVAVVSTGKGDDLDENSIRRHLDQHLGRYKHPRHIVITDSLPRTGLEKIAYPEIGAMVEEHLAVAASPKT